MGGLWAGEMATARDDNSFGEATRSRRDPSRGGRPWPALAVRRILLDDVFLHELGHLQIVAPKARSDRLRFARKKLAEALAVEWRYRLWAAPLAHPDPVHRPPRPEELDALRGLAEGVPDQDGSVGGTI
jgi:hypothetical protein